MREWQKIPPSSEYYDKAQNNMKIAKKKLPGEATSDEAPEETPVETTERDTYKEYTELESIPSRSENPNAVLIDVGTEPLIIGVEFMRFIRIGKSLLPYLSMGGGVGSWLKGPAFWGTMRFYLFGENNWAPFFGTSVALWNGNMPKAGEDDVTAKINALGVYIPLGIQYHGKNGLIISYEMAVHVITTADWEVKEVEKQPETTFGLGKGETKKPQIWGGIKIGFSF